MKRFALVCLFWFATSFQASALDLTDMSDAERSAFGAAVREYLLSNPEVLVEVINLLEQRQNQAQVQGDKDLIAANASALFADGFSFVGGNPDGDITIVEFLDYRCGYCKRAHPEVKALLKQDGNIRYIIKEFPILGEQSTLASRFALSVKITEGDEAYFTVHNALMEANGQVTDGSLRRLARTVGLDVDAVMDGMDNPTIDLILQTNYQLAQVMQITGTPSFVMGNTMMRGYAPLDTMKQVVAEQRANSDG